jgi:DNA-binding transcriptional MerR regulator
MTGKVWMTPDEVREYLGGISERTLARYRKLGLHANYVTPNTPRYFKDEVDEWIVSRAAQNREEVSCE